MPKNTKQQNITQAISLSKREQIYIKHGLKTEWVKKTSSSIVMSQKPVK